MPEELSVQRSTLVSDPPGLSISDLKPGDTLEKTVIVTNSSPYPVELSSHVSQDGALFDGAHPLVVRFDVDAASGGGCAGDAHALSAGSRATVTVDVAFPAAAGNEYQAQSGAATLFFTATQLAPEQCVPASPPPIADGPARLPQTGVDASGVIALSVALVVTGVLVRSLVRRHEARRWNA